jgi:hypothetical protein
LIRGTKRNNSRGAEEKRRRDKGIENGRWFTVNLLLLDDTEPVF